MANVKARLLAACDLSNASFGIGDFHVSRRARANGSVSFAVDGDYKFIHPFAADHPGVNLSLLFQRYAPTHGEKALDLEALERETGQLALNAGERDSLRESLDQFSGKKGAWHGSVALEWFARFAQERFLPTHLLENARARWQSSLKSISPEVAFFRVSLCKRAAVGLGTASPWENSGWAFHQTYGVPIIPGDSLKGLARHYLEGECRGQSGEHLLAALGLVGMQAKGVMAKIEDKESHVPLAPERLATLLFGKGGSKGAGGFLAVHDAFPYEPLAEGTGPLTDGWFDLDVVTSHHRAYYADTNSNASDTEDPKPAYHLALRPGLAFDVALGVTTPGRRRTAEEQQAFLALGRALLVTALQDLGAGARTGSGYGRMKVKSGDQGGTV